MRTSNQILADSYDALRKKALVVIRDWQAVMGWSAEKRELINFSKDGITWASLRWLAEELGQDIPIPTGISKERERLNLRIRINEMTDELGDLHEQLGKMGR